MKAIQLKTEYLHEPIGLSIVFPRLFWQCEGGIKQSAYHIIAARDNEVVWDSGKIFSDRMTHVRYNGKKLNSRDRIEWKVKLWDESDTEGQWTSSWFEMGLLNATDWGASWITGDYTPEKNVRYPVDCFRKSFMANKSLLTARLYMTSCGLYRAKINGEQVGKYCLAPGCTDYRTRLQYQAYDVTAMIQGNNTMDIELADGWYRGSIGAFGLTNVFGRETKLLCQLELRYADGTCERIVSDGSFLWSNDGPIRFADLKDGEVYDASRSPSYSGQAKLTDESVVPTASNNVDVCEHECLKADLILTPSGKKVLDFGQNIAGFISFTVKGEKGQIVRIRCGEILDKNGELSLENIQLHKPELEFDQATEMLLITGRTNQIEGKLVPTPRQELEFICSGNKDEYKMSFSIFGFQYAQIDTDIDFDVDDFHAVAVYSAMEPSGTFACSHEKINRFMLNTLWSMKGNFLDIPTDCPTRERLGWTGDGQIFFNTSAYLMNVASFFRKWMVDIADAQFPDGKSSAVVPYAGADMLYKHTGASVGWNDAVVLIPYRYWKRYGDDAILSDFYDVMRKYAMFMIENTGHRDEAQANENPYNSYTYEKGMHLGEWLEPEEFRDQDIGMSAVHPEECTAYLHYTMRHMTEIAHHLGHADDEAMFREYAEGAKKSYNWQFLQSGTIDTDRQAKLVRPLALGLLDGTNKRNVQERLVQAVENRDYCISTGFLSTPFILPALTDAGRSDVAYKMLENEKSPSWLSEVAKGATTVWENWDGKDSRNHYSPGAVCEWLFQTVGGIDVASENMFRIKPIPGGSLQYAAAEYDSIYGKVSCKWERNGEDYRYIIEVPPNTSAEVLLPGKDKQIILSGTYVFEQ